MKTGIRNLSVLPQDVEFVEHTLESFGFMFTKKPSVTFPFSNTHKGFVYTYRCTTMQAIKILDIVSINPLTNKKQKP